MGRPKQMCWEGMDWIKFTQNAENWQALLCGNLIHGTGSMDRSEWLLRP